MLADLQGRDEGEWDYRDAKMSKIKVGVTEKCDARKLVMIKDD